MEKRDAFILLALLGAAGYGVHANWDAITVKLGLTDLYPGRVKAIELAKKARIFDQYRTNWEVLKDRESGKEIQVVGDPWTAEPAGESRYRVLCTFKEDAQLHRHQFDVDVGTGAVEYAGEVGAPGGAGPR